MLKEFNIGENRRVIVKKVNGEFVVIIEEQGSEMKRVTLPRNVGPRFSSMNLKSIKI